MESAPTTYSMLSAMPNISDEGGFIISIIDPLLAVFMVVRCVWLWDPEHELHSKKVFFLFPQSSQTS